MKISIDKSILINGLDTASKAVATKGSLQILEGILLEAGDGLRVTGNNLEFAIQTNVDCEVLRPGSIVANAKLLIEIVRKMPDEEIDLIVTGNEMSIEAGRTVMKIPVMESNGFPAIPVVNAERSFEMDAIEFRDLIGKVSFAAYTENDRPTMKGIYFDISGGVLNAVAIDGRMMAMRTFKQDAPDSSILILAKDLDTAAKAFNGGKVKISMDDKMTLLENDSVKVQLRQIDGVYMKYKNIIPSEFETAARVKTKELQSVIERAILIFDADSKVITSPLIITIKGDIFKAKMDSKLGNIDDGVLADVTGNDLTIGIDPRKMNECLRRIEDKEILLKFNGSMGPCVMVPTEGDKFLYFVLPVKIKE